MKIPRRLYDELIEHALEEAPNECCGLIGVRDGAAVRTFRARNVAKNPQARYAMDPEEQLQLHQLLDAAGLDLGAIYHSHPFGPAFPSLTDIRLAFSETMYLIVSLAHNHPQVKAYQLHTGDPVELAYEVME